MEFAISSSLVTSDRRYLEFLPSSSLRICPFSSDRPEIITFAPSSIKSLAVSAPIPLVPPVMSATLLSNLLAIFIPYLSIHKLH